MGQPIKKAVEKIRPAHETARELIETSMKLAGQLDRLDELIFDFTYNTPTDKYIYDLRKKDIKNAIETIRRNKRLLYKLDGEQWR